MKINFNLIKGNAYFGKRIKDFKKYRAMHLLINLFLF